MSYGCQDSGAEGARAERAQHGSPTSLQGVNALLTPHAATGDSACMASISPDQPAGSTAQRPQPPSTPLAPGAQHRTQGSASNFHTMSQTSGQGAAPQAPSAPGPASLVDWQFPGPEATTDTAHPEGNSYSCNMSTRSGAMAGGGLSTCNPPLAPGQGQTAWACPLTSPDDPQGGSAASPQASPAASYQTLVSPDVHPAAVPSSGQVPSPAANHISPAQPAFPHATTPCGGGSYHHLSSSPAASVSVSGCNTPQPAIIVLSTPQQPAPSYEDALHAPPCPDAPTSHPAAPPALQGAQASTNIAAGVVTVQQDEEDLQTPHTAAIAAAAAAAGGVGDEEEDDDEADCTSLDSAYLSPASASDDCTSGSEPLTPTTPRPAPSVPLLPPCDDPHRKTLVLDLDGTLIASEDEPHAPVPFDYCVDEERFVWLRPGLRRFLAQVRPLFEVVLFTAAGESWATCALQRIDPTASIFDSRLYRDHTVSHDDWPWVKDLSRLGRDLARTVIVDDNPLMFMYQPDNALHVAAYDPQLTAHNDDVLEQVLDILMHKILPADDVREVLRELKDPVQPSCLAARRQMHCGGGGAGAGAGLGPLCGTSSTSAASSLTSSASSSAASTLSGAASAGNPIGTSGHLAAAAMAACSTPTAAAWGGGRGPVHQPHGRAARRSLTGDGMGLPQRQGGGKGARGRRRGPPTMAPGEAQQHQLQQPQQQVWAAHGRAGVAAGATGVHSHNPWRWGAQQLPLEVLVPGMVVQDERGNHQQPGQGQPGQAAKGRRRRRGRGKNGPRQPHSGSTALPTPASMHPHADDSAQGQAQGQGQHSSGPRAPGAARNHTRRQARVQAQAQQQQDPPQDSGTQKPSYAGVAAAGLARSVSPSFSQAARGGPAPQQSASSSPPPSPHGPPTATLPVRPLPAALQQLEEQPQLQAKLTQIRVRRRLMSGDEIMRTAGG